MKVETKIMKMMVDKKYIFTNKLCVMLIAVVCTALWGNMIPAIRVGFGLWGISKDDIASEILFAGACFTLSGLFTLLLPCAKEKRFVLPNKKSYFGIFILGLIQTFIQYILLYVGIPNASGFNASLISASGTFLIIILSHFVYKNDKMGKNKVFGRILGILGVIFLDFDSIHAFTPTFTFMGEGMIFLSTLTFVFTTPLCKKLAKFESSEIFTGYSFVIGGIPLVLVGLIFGGKLIFSINAVIMLVYLALAAAVAGVLWNYLLEYNKVSEVSIYNFLVPIFGAVSSMFMLNENIFQINNIFALLFTCLGIYYVEKTQRNICVSSKKLGRNEV